MKRPSSSSSPPPRAWRHSCTTSTPPPAIGTRSPDATASTFCERAEGPARRAGPSCVRGPRDALARLAMHGVLAAPPAVLVELDPIAIVHTVLDRVVVPSPAVRAGERDLRTVPFLLGHGSALSLVT